MADEPTFDVFVSYSHDDEAWARRLFAELEDRALSFRTADVPSVEGSAQDAVARESLGAVSQSCSASTAAQQSGRSRARWRVLGDRPRLVLSLGLGPKTPWATPSSIPSRRRRTERARCALAPEQMERYRAATRRARRAPMPPGRRRRLKLESSVAELSRRLRGELTGARRSSAESHLERTADTARGEGQTSASERNPIPPSGSRWARRLDEVSGGHRHDEAGRVAVRSPGPILGLGLCYPPLGRRLMASRSCSRRSEGETSGTAGRHPHPGARQAGSRGTQRRCRLPATSPADSQLGEEHVRPVRGGKVAALCPR